jgi:basic amino acid/polyamine antiporter, APA family
MPACCSRLSVRNRYLIPPIHDSSGYAISRSNAQLLALIVIALLTWTITRGIDYGRLVQNVFTVAKTAAVIVLIVVGLVLGTNAPAVSTNFAQAGTPPNLVPIMAALDATSLYGLLVALAIAQVGSLFASDAWKTSPSRQAR